jgi:hypothetical protein
MPSEELACDIEDAGLFDALRFRSATRVLADLDLERAGDLVEIGAVEADSGLDAWTFQPHP